ncbi:hypothetical protein RJ641_001389 [Dillenia turbinata]|uniref:PH domain-containing protein n=1 Tax=Dillenia turbinata TaxID=194707 RepID=A0AAN8WFK7_9MAGN
MDDGLGKIKVIPDYFEVSTPTGGSVQKKVSNSHPKSDKSLRIDPKSRGTMLNLFKVPGLPWGSSDKAELNAAQVESLRSELALLEEREAHLKAQLENIDEILRSACLCSYLYIRTVRWIALPGEPPPLDDTDVDDWLPRFVVLQGDCIFFYLLSTDLSPQDSTLLSDIVEVGPLPSFTREDEQTHYAFYILTCHGLRYECSNTSRIQVDSWLVTLQSDCSKSGDEAKSVSDSSTKQNKVC